VVGWPACILGCGLAFCLIQFCFSRNNLAHHDRAAQG
jgi:hypothetical protein